MTSIDLPLRTIRVYGTLAKVLKRRTFKAVVSSPKDAIRFLLVNFPEVQQYLKPRFFRISMGNYCINEHELNYPAGSDEEIHIVPAVCGAGAVSNIIAGVILVTASIFFPFLAPVLLPLGIGLTFLGIGQLLTSVPTVGDSQSNPLDSFNFSGIQQTSREGPPVPVVYGEIFTGSIVISSGFDEYDEEIELGLVEDEGDPNPAEDSELFPQVYSTDYCAEHQYTWTIEACLTMSWTTSRCGPGYVNSCQTVTIGGRTLPTGFTFPDSEAILWEAVGECNCGPFWENKYNAGCALLFRTGPGDCNDNVIQRGATFSLPSAVCGNPPDYVSGMSWSIIGAEINDQFGNRYPVDPAGFPHTGFLDNL